MKGEAGRCVCGAPLTADGLHRADCPALARAAMAVIDAAAEREEKRARAREADRAEP